MMLTPLPAGEAPMFDDLTLLSMEAQLERLQELQDRFNGRDGIVPHRRIVKSASEMFDYMDGWLERRNIDVLMEGMTYTKFERELNMRKAASGTDTGPKLVPPEEPSDAYKLYCLLMKSLEPEHLNSIPVREIIGGIEFYAHFGQFAFATLPK